MSEYQGFVSLFIDRLSEHARSAAASGDAYMSEAYQRLSDHVNNYGNMHNKKDDVRATDCFAWVFSNNQFQRYDAPGKYNDYFYLMFGYEPS